MLKVENKGGFLTVSNGSKTLIISKNDRWITVKRNHEDEEEKGRHLLVKDGETPKEAMERQWKINVKDKKDDEKKQPIEEKQTKEEDLTKYTDDELQEIKRSEQLSNAYKNFKPAKNITEAKETMAVITGDKYNLMPDNVEIDVVNDMNKASLEIISKYNLGGLKTYGMGNMRGSTFMHANDELVEIAPKLLRASKEEIEKFYKDVSTPRAEALKERMEQAQRNIEHYKKAVEELEEKKASGEKINEFDLIWKKSRIKDSEKDLRGFEKESKFIRWTTQTSAENFVRDTTYHEFGHVVMGRAEKIKDVDVWKKVESAFRKARKNGDIYNISQYSNKNRDEFFAETFAMRQTGQKLPDYVDEMLDYVININKGEQK